jgi:hypothetical protein
MNGVYQNGGVMLRVSASAIVLAAGLALAGCSGDDTVNPTNPDASSATTKPADAAVEGSKGDASKEGGGSKDDGAAGDAGKGSEGGAAEGAADAPADGETDAETHEEGGGDT